MAKKSMIIALILSFIWSGLGLMYAGDIKNGIILAVLAIIFQVMFLLLNPICGTIVFIIWIYSLYATYKQVKAVNSA